MQVLSHCCDRARHHSGNPLAIWDLAKSEVSSGWWVQVSREVRSQGGKCGWTPLMDIEFSETDLSNNLFRYSGLTTAQVRLKRPAQV